ncbi:hypothetical protein LY11_04693 [Pedobacter cryoconitis]|uniref:Uncharacterized protein n=1 Tax=Pedobacter cryoconitis TaxID=188932 RepID=A0A327S0M3_9SPHI|nr:hypothetical protein LY11_04693 [Pedobacter cryoconitis]
MARCWYAYNGVGDPLVLSSYILASRVPACINGFVVCAVYAPSCGINPSVLSVRIRYYIGNLTLTLVAQPDGTTKKYVYGKN